MDEREAKFRNIEIHRRGMSFIRGYVTCMSCACNYTCSKPEEKTFCQIYSRYIDPADSDRNILMAEACDQWVFDGMDRTKVITPDHKYSHED